MAIYQRIRFQEWNTSTDYCFVMSFFQLLSVAVIGVSVTTAFATKIYSSDMSGRLVAMIILAVTAAIALSIAMYAVIAVFRNQVKPVHAVSGRALPALGAYLSTVSRHAGSIFSSPHKSTNDYLKLL